MLLLQTTLALLACTQEPQAPSAPATPEVTNLVVQIPSTAKVGEKIQTQVSYTLTEGCWTTESVFSQPTPMAFVDTTVHTRNGQDCVTGENSTMMQIPMTQAGAVSLTILLDGKTVAEQTIQVEPAE